MPAHKHSKLGLAAFILAIAGSLVLGFLVVSLGYDSDVIFFHKEALSAPALTAFLLGLISLFLPRTKKTYGLLAVALSCLMEFALVQLVLHDVLSMSKYD